MQTDNLTVEEAYLLAIMMEERIRAARLAGFKDTHSSSIFRQMLMGKLYGIVGRLLHRPTSPPPTGEVRAEAEAEAREWIGLAQAAMNTVHPRLALRYLESACKALRASFPDIDNFVIPRQFGDCGVISVDGECTS